MLLNEAHNVLHDISTLASALKLRLSQLPAVRLMNLADKVSEKSKFKDKSYFMEETAAHLMSISDAAQQVKSQLPKKVSGGRVTLEAAVSRKLGQDNSKDLPDNREFFVSRTVKIFRTHRPDSPLSGNKRSESKGCYAFVTAVFRHATGSDFGQSSFASYMKKRHQILSARGSRLSRGKSRGTETSRK